MFVWRILAAALALAHLTWVARAVEPVVPPEQMPRIPPTEAGKAAATFAVRSGFHAELVASEPLVASPVAMAVDELGRAYVVEMRDYSEQRPEHLGRIRRLEDTDGDGRYDTSTVFLADLPWPTAITCWNGGVFIGATPDVIYAKDTTGDGVADVREVVFTGFASDYAPYATNKLNVQAMMNSFQWGLDNRIHGSASLSGGKVGLVDSEFTREWRARTAAGNQSLPTPWNTNRIDVRGRDFSFDPRTLELRVETGGGQHGMSFDDTGRKFVCSNSDHLQLIAFDDTGLVANPNFEMPVARVSIAADGPAAEVFRRSPDEPWRVLRTRWRVAGLVEGPIEGGGRPSGYFTGATGATIYRGDACGADDAGDAFIGDAGSNLVHRKKLRPGPDGILLVGERAADETKSEFLASSDNWFRPVQFYNAPDGCLWVLDMYREVIEHPWSLPANLKTNLDLTSGRDRGRIWRLAPDGFEGKSKKFEGKNSETSVLVEQLASANGWRRDTAARLLYERQDTNAGPALKTMLNTSTHRLARLHALRALDGLGQLDAPNLAGALRDADAAVRRHAVRLAVKEQPDMLREALPRLVEDPDPLVRLEVAFAVARLPRSERAAPLARLIRSGPFLVQSAAIHAAGDADGELFVALRPERSNTSEEPAPRLENPSEPLSQLCRTIGRRNDPSAVQTVIDRLPQLADERLAFVLTASLGEGLQQSGSSLRAADSQQLLTPVIAKAREKIQPMGAARAVGSTRRESVELFTQLPWAEARMVLLDLLDTNRTPAWQQTGVVALSRFNEPEATRALVAAVPALPPEIRRDAITVLLRRSGSTTALLDATEAGRIPATDFTVEQLNQLRRHRDAAIRERSGRLFGELPANRQEVIDRFVPALNLHGDGQRGAVVFRERCATCHVFRGEGVALGPDLASVTANGPEKLLVSILDPNREVAPNFTAWTVETKSGESVTGVLTREADSSVTLKLAGGAETTFARTDLARMKPEGRSLMPEGLEAGLTPEDIASLLAWLTTPP